MELFLSQSLLGLWHVLQQRKPGTRLSMGTRQMQVLNLRRKFESLKMEELETEGILKQTSQSCKSDQNYG